LLLPVQFVQIVLSTDGHEGFRYDITNRFTVLPYRPFALRQQASALSRSGQRRL
jgi:hypothetical protein